MLGLIRAGFVKTREFNNSKNQSLIGNLEGKENLYKVETPTDNFQHVLQV